LYIIILTKVSGIHVTFWVYTQTTWIDKLPRPQTKWSKRSIECAVFIKFLDSVIWVTKIHYENIIFWIYGDSWWMCKVLRAINQNSKP
jgi:hypothetical protein